MEAQIEPCAANSLAARNALLHPELTETRAEIQSKISEILQNLQETSQSRAVVTIPVVVHLVYRTAAENISDAQVKSQIEVLNKDFRRKNADAANTPLDFLLLAADMEIEFCLAQTDPTGKPSTGITRRATTFDNIASLYSSNNELRVCHSTLGGTDGWNPDLYLNIWVAKIGGGLLGFATFPGTAPADEDGVFIDPRYFGTTGLTLQYAPNHLGRTCTHEVGHFLDLYHIWGENSTSCDDDDGVGDTPRQRGPSAGCLTHPQLSCGVRSMFMNFMDYTHDSCMNLFTQGQKARAKATLQTARQKLMNSPICSTVPTGEPPIFEEKISIFPNPTAGELQIRLPDDFGQPSEVQIFDVLGKKMEPNDVQFSGNAGWLDLQNLPSGMYFLKLKSGVWQQVLPFFKK